MKSLSLGTIILIIGFFSDSLGIFEFIESRSNYSSENPTSVILTSNSSSSPDAITPIPNQNEGTIKPIPQPTDTEAIFMIPASPETSLPSPTQVLNEPPEGFYPVNSAFDGLWRNNQDIRNQLGYPITEVDNLAGAYQHFQNGTMIWLGGGTKNLIYLLYWEARQEWELYDDKWRDGMQWYDLKFSVLTQPIRGFGFVWRDNTDVRNRIGNTRYPEDESEVIFQLFQRGIGVHFVRPNISYVLIESENEEKTWVSNPLVQTTLPPTPTPPQPVTCDSDFSESGRQFQAYVQSGCYYRFHLSCEDCNPWAFNNFVLSYRGRPILIPIVEGSIKQYDYLPDKDEFNCKNGDFWPEEVPPYWQEYGFTLYFPCAD